MPNMFMTNAEWEEFVRTTWRRCATTAGVSPEEIAQHEDLVVEYVTGWPAEYFGDALDAGMRAIVRGGLPK